jgi:hypothetical protein
VTVDAGITAVAPAAAVEGAAVNGERAPGSPVADVGETPATSDQSAPLPDPVPVQEPTAVAPETEPAKPETEAAKTVAPTDTAPAPLATSPPAATAPAEKPTLRDLCRQAPEGDGTFEGSRRRLAETFCGATLWFDGLFGGIPDVESARAVSGRIELSGLHTDFDGFRAKARLRLNYELPNLQRRVRLFLGREDRDFTADRGEGFAVRSAVFGLQEQDDWLAGLGYSPPGRYFRRVDVGVGMRVKSASEVFVQTRYRRNLFAGASDVWRFRETVFWENRDGFGTTTSLDWDRVLGPNRLLRWGNVGTVSQDSEGLEWRSALIVYHNLRNARAWAGEVFLRGATAAEVPLREFGGRIIYRQPLRGRHLFGDVIAGYTWPQTEDRARREGSAMLGLGVEMLFGHQPY